MLWAYLIADAVLLGVVYCGTYALYRFARIWWENK